MFEQKLPISDLENRVRDAKLSYVRAQQELILAKNIEKINSVPIPKGMSWDETEDFVSHRLAQIICAQIDCDVMIACLTE